MKFDFLQEQDFVSLFETLQRDAAEINRKSGFSQDNEFVSQLSRLIGLVPPNQRSEFLPLVSAFKGARVGLKLALTMGELGEALEAVRKDMGEDKHCSGFSAEEIEIADAVIRLMNYAYDRNLRLAEGIIAKNEYNRNRHDHKPEERAKDGGKKF